MGLAPALYDVVVSLVVSGVGENAGAAASCGGNVGERSQTLCAILSTNLQHCLRFSNSTAQNPKKTSDEQKKSCSSWTNIVVKVLLLWGKRQLFHIKSI